MNENEWLTALFESHRTHLCGVAYRMLGSVSEAEDATQETWLRLCRAETKDVANLGGWLTTVTARICLDMLRSRKSRREESFGVHAPSQLVNSEDGRNPEQEAVLADSVGLALLVVLETLTPNERIAFVLHDMFDLPFDEIAPIVGSSSTATRQLASRARRRIQGSPSISDTELTQQRKLIDSFLAASRNDDLTTLLQILDPDIVLRSDFEAMRLGSSEEAHGADAVSRHFLGRAQDARPALVNGALGVVVAPRGKLFLVLNLTIIHERIVAIDVIADPAHLLRLNLAVLND